MAVAWSTTQLCYVLCVLSLSWPEISCKLCLNSLWTETKTVYVYQKNSQKKSVKENFLWNTKEFTLQGTQFEFPRGITATAIRTGHILTWVCSPNSLQNSYLACVSSESLCRSTTLCYVNQHCKEHVDTKSIWGLKWRITGNKVGVCLPTGQICCCKLQTPTCCSYFHCFAVKLVTQNWVLGPKQTAKFSNGKRKHRVLWDGPSQPRNLLGILCCRILSISPCPKWIQTGITETAGKWSLDHGVNLWLCVLSS